MIQDGDVNNKGKICKKMEEKRKEKTIFSYRIFDICPYQLTQISSLRTHWMQNIITHPTHTHTAYF